MLTADGLCKSYWDRSSRSFQRILDHCSLSIGEGEAVGLMGPSGCGKSTLARVLLRLISAEKGRIFFDGRDISQSRGTALRPFRQAVQLISQRPESFFDPLWTLGDSLREPLDIFGLPCDPAAIESALDMVKLDTGLLARYPHQVSGGEIQRVSIARALLMHPRCLILDEPTSMLDISVQAQILHVLKHVREETGIAWLLISHDKEVVRWMCDTCLRMEEGKLSLNG